MQKISGIIPNSNRVGAVDLKDAHPVRPGTPSFGRPEGVSTLRDSAMISTAARGAQELNEKIFPERTKEAMQAESVQRISDSFFMKNRTEVEPSLKARTDAGAVASASSVSDTAPGATSGAGASFFPSDDSDGGAESGGSPYPKGSFLDVRA